MAGVWRNGGALAAASALGSHAALAWGWGAAALPLAAVQALAVGWVLGSAVPRWLRGLGPGAALLLLGALGLGARHSPAAGLLALAGASHALVYAGLLALFASTLRRGRVPLVTSLARRLNPAFHGAMEGYTRGVTAAWSAFFAGQLAASGLLLMAAPAWWPGFVGLPSLLLAVAMAVAERVVRGLRFPAMAHVPVSTIIRAWRAGAGPGTAGAGAAQPAAGHPGHSGSATPRPPPAGDSGPAPAA